MTETMATDIERIKEEAELSITARGALDLLGLPSAAWTWGTDAKENGGTIRFGMPGPDEGDQREIDGYHGLSDITGGDIKVNVEGQLAAGRGYYWWCEFPYERRSEVVAALHDSAVERTVARTI